MTDASKAGCICPRPGEMVSDRGRQFRCPVHGVQTVAWGRPGPWMDWPKPAGVKRV